MSFNSFGFILAFLPVTLFIYWMLRKKGQNGLSVWFLVLASVFFYCVNYPVGIVPFALSLIVNWLLCRKILLTGKKGFLITGVVFNVLLLCIYKYGVVLFHDTAGILSAPGISFYTFCAIALLAECNAGTVRDLSVKEYTFLMTFFPKITQGPITVPSDILPQKEGKSGVDIESVYRGVLLFLLGCFKKVIIADTLGAAVDYGFSNLEAMHTGEALIIMLSYTLQLYFDFSGYCDMAMAVASFFGFELPLNFDSPYKARNIADFWKRWHMSLTRFLTRYIYIPLGGSRKGLTRTCINVLIVFFISGIWHGAGVTFIIWGMMHGVMMVIYRLYSTRRKARAAEDGDEKKGSRLSGALSVALTFIYVNAAWVFFRAPRIKDALSLFESMADVWFPRFNYGLAKCFNIEELWYVIKILNLDGWNNSIYILMFVILIALVALVMAAPSAAEFSKNCRIGIVTTVLMIVLAVWCLLSFEGVATYLYVNF
ncbi:MAG: MBOAT family protein [Lachnospiraceae bacterium]|nr:MBOAT family protein [Lachnospiraceae bacterium]